MPSSFFKHPVLNSPYGYWVPGVNKLKTHGSWAFSEFTDVWEIEADFEAKVGAEFEKMLAAATSKPVTT